MAKTYQIITQLPKNFYQQVEALAVKENLSLDQLVALALSAQVKAWSDKNALAECAERGSWEDFQSILAQVPDVQLEAFDRL